MLKQKILHLNNFLVLVVLAALLIWFGPDERTLGGGIKTVYLHVALMWTGMTGLLVLGLLGLINAVKPTESLQRWCHDLGWLALAFLLGGIGMSMVASIVNWGGIFWQEPRTLAMMRVVAVALIVQVVAGWPINLRLKGVLYLGLAGFLVWSVRSATLVLHPRNPIGTSPSLAIQATFFGLFGLMALLLIWLLLRWRSQASSSTSLTYSESPLS